MTMTVGELRELIQDLDDDMEVRIAHQPNYPLECGAGAQVVDLNPPGGEDGEIDEEGFPTEPEGEPEEVLYIYESGSVGTGYLPGIVSSAIGWR